jgi:hypothetical protein
LGFVNYSAFDIVVTPAVFFLTQRQTEAIYSHLQREVDEQELEDYPIPRAAHLLSFRGINTSVTIRIFGLTRHRVPDIEEDVLSHITFRLSLSFLYNTQVTDIITTTIGFTYYQEVSIICTVDPLLLEIDPPTPPSLSPPSEPEQDSDQGF